jgi:hypothetical protein
VIRIPGEDGLLDHRGFPRLIGKAPLAQHAANGRGTEMQTSAAERLGDLGLSEGRAEHAELLDDVGDEVGELVHGSVDLDDRGRSFFVEASHPRGYGGRRDVEAVGGLVQRPSSSGAEFENGEPFPRLVVGPVVSRHPEHAGVLDADLLGEQGHFLAQTLDLGSEPDPAAAVSRGLAAGADEADPSHGENVEDGGTHLARPALGQSGYRTIHRALRENRVKSRPGVRITRCRATTSRGAAGCSESVAPPLSSL